jgi:hypothetical protein
VVTIVHHAAGCTVSVDGTGVAGTDDGARRVLGMLLEEMAAVARQNGHIHRRGPLPNP